jgi:hypothetical protein
MASRFSASDVAVLSREQKIEALGIALRMKATHIRWTKGGEVMTDQECLDAAIEHEFDPTRRPRLTYTYGDGINWADQDAWNPYRWRSRSWLYRLWKTDPLPTSPDYYALRRKKLWTLDPEWDVPWPHEPGRPDLPLEEPEQRLEQASPGDGPPTP